MTRKTTPWNLRLLASLILPITVLASSVFFYEKQLLNGEEVKLKVQGLDPRDLLSGHYLIYQIDYELPKSEAGCPATDISAALCLKPERSVYPSDEKPESCKVWLSGNCNSQRIFISGLERFYVPEDQAKALESKVLNEHAEIVVKVAPDGSALVKTLLINGIDWRDTLKNNE